MHVFDPTYFLFIGPAIVLSLIAAWLTKSRFNKYSRVRSAYGFTGAQAAQAMLDRAGIRDVRVIPSSGFLSDHYNPVNKTLALSEEVYGRSTISAIGVACHEAGHAVQHARHYPPLWVRSALVPTAGIGSNLGMLVMFLGLVLFQSPKMVLVGAVLFSAVLLFQIVTLPVEFDASARAKKLAFEYGLVTAGEREGVAKVLNAAALTYVAAAVSTLLTLLYYLLQAGLLGRRD